MAKDDLIRLRLPSELKARVMADAKAAGLTASEWMRRAAEAHLMGAGQREAARAALEPEVKALDPTDVPAPHPGDEVGLIESKSVPIGKCWEMWCEKRGPVGEVCPAHPKERFR